MVTSFHYPKDEGDVRALIEAGAHINAKEE